MHGGLIDWRQLFLSPRGRVSRGPCWISVGVLLLASAVYEAVAGSTLKLLTFWFVYPALLGSGGFVLSKRLHDRGRSGWWAGLVLLALMMVWPTPRGGRAVVAAPVLVWAIVELGILSGEQGANRFGPSPLAPSAT